MNHNPDDDDGEDFQPSLPYPEPSGEHTSGHSGSDTSRDRALNEARDGVTAKRQRLALEALAYLGSKGATWSELGDILNLHHGQVTSVLSNLDRDHRVAQLTERRLRSHVYVLPGHVDGRDVAKPRKRRLCPHCGEPI